MRTMLVIERKPRNIHFARALHDRWRYPADMAGAEVDKMITD